MFNNHYDHDNTIAGHKRNISGPFETRDSFEERCVKKQKQGLRHRMDKKQMLTNFHGTEIFKLKPSNHPLITES